MDERLERYITELFAPEDAILTAIRERHAALGLPPILISPDEGKLLHVLLRAVGATRVLEIGALAGYSGVWLARALPRHGRLTTIERDPRHAALARRSYAEAGLGDRVELIEGAALAVVPTLAPGFDAVFVDADKEPLAQYFDWSVRLLRAVGATRVLEIGALAGYSGVWLARALPRHGRLTTIERDPRHAALARRSYTEAGLVERVELIEGAALAVLPTLAPGFDAVFVDADKEPLAQYFDWSVRLLRAGGLLLCDNAFFHGSVVDDADHSPGTEGVRAFNRLAATDPRVVSAVAPIRDGLVIGVRVSP